jgi:hypothetical protein
VESEARVPTARPAVYLKQLCRHFGHRVPAEFTDESGRIEFDLGVCELTAEPELLVLRVSGADADAVSRLEEVVGSHLQRFAHHRDELEVTWSRQ